MSDHVSKLKVGKSELLCKNGCGFFGNPEWNWYCSRCWRLHNAKHQSYVFDSGPPAGATGTSSQFISPGKAQSLPTPPTKERSSPLQNFIKKSPGAGKGKLSPSHSAMPKALSPQRKKVDKKTSLDIKQMFKKTTLGKDDFKPRDRSRDDRPPQPPEAKAISKQFAEYLNPRVKKAGIADLSRNIQSFIDKVHRKIEVLSIEEMSSMVQAFYLALAKRLEAHENFIGLEEEERAIICDMTERYVMVCCYKVLFCPFSTEDEEKDLEIQARIRSLNWVTAGHLECPFKETSPEVRDLIYTAINDILELDGSKAPQDKLASVVKCSKNIFAILHSANEGPSSADDFFPSLVYIFLKANPPRVLSNINFITRFANEQRLRSGEGGYYFTNVAAAMAFIDKLTAHDLNLPQPEFDSYMTGEAIPPGSWEASLLMCEGIQTMSQNLKALSDLRDLQSKIMTDAETLERDMTELSENISQEVAAVLARTKFTIHGPKRPVAVDSNDLPGPGTLPPPLVPLSHQPDSLPPPLVPLTNQPPIVPSDEESNPPGGAGMMDIPEGGGMVEMDLAGALAMEPPSHLELMDQADGGDRSLLDDTPSKPDLPSPILPQMEASHLSSAAATGSSESPSALSNYFGFSAQSFSIPSISCNTAASDLLSPPSPLLQPSSDYSSSHPSPSSFASPLSFPSSQPSPSSFTPSTSPSDSPDSGP